MAKLGLTVPDVPQTGTIVHVAIDGKYAGYLLISDVVKPHSAQAIKGLKQAGVRKTVMLTGDAEPVAKAVSAELGIDEYHAGLLPGDKVDQIEKLLAAKNPKEMLAFVGDGINDAPCRSWHEPPWSLRDACRRAFHGRASDSPRPIGRGRENSCPVP